MSRRFLSFSVIALVTLSAFAVQAQQAPGGGPGQPPSMEHMQQRFHEMDQTVDKAHNEHGAQRHELMQKHMQMMLDMMPSMHAMMRGGVRAGAGMGQRPDMGGRAEEGMAPGGDRLRTMEQRMDLMQQMMEQMLKQQQMMLSPDDK